MRGEELDSIDRAILVVMRDEARLTHADIARRLEEREIPLSASAVARRVSAMEDSGVIVKYVTVVDYQRAEKAVEAYIEVTLHSGVNLDEAIETFLSWQEVREASLVTGDADVMLRIRVGDIDDFRRFIQKLRGSTYVQRSKTLMAIGRVNRSPAGFATPLGSVKRARSTRSATGLPAGET